MKIDLHMHTTASDGSDTPEELLEKILAAGYEYFSVTDHDSTSACLRVGRRLSLMQKGSADGKQEDGTAGSQDSGSNQLPAFIPGIELSCEDEKGKYHILGYGYQYEWGNVLRLTHETHALRMAKLSRRLQNLREAYGITFPEEELAALYQLDNPGKPHIGRLMVKYGYARSISEAIKGVLNKYSPPEGHIRPEQAIRAVLADGGVPVLAHAIYGDGDQLIMGPELGERIERLMNFGLMGLECFYSGFSPKQRQIMLSLAEHYDLYVTAGSDYHGTNKLIELGDTGLDEEGGTHPRLVEFLEHVTQ